MEPCTTQLRERILHEWRRRKGGLTKRSRRHPRKHKHPVTRRKKGGDRREHGKSRHDKHGEDEIEGGEEGEGEGEGETLDLGEEEELPEVEEGGKDSLDWLRRLSMTLTKTLGKYQAHTMYLLPLHQLISLL